jgi:outer membrane receptor protein involved in Fe transport
MGSTPNIVAAAGPSTALTLKSGGSLGAFNTYIPAGTAPGVTSATLAAGLLANAGQQNHNPADTTQFKGLRGLLGTPSATRSFRASVRREMTSRLEWFTDFSYGSTRTDKDDWSVATTLAVPANSPINPFNQAVNLAVPFKTKSPSATQSLTRTFTTGVLAKLPYQWLGHADYTWSQGYNSYVASASGYNNAELSAAILAGAVNPFVDTQQYPLALGPYLSYSKWFGYGTLNDVNLRLSGPVWRLPGGAPQLTIGLSRRQEGTASAPTYVDVPGFPARNTATMNLGKKQITESAYAEANLPIIGETNRRWFARQLDLQFAARVEQFQVNTGTASITLLPAPATPPVIRNNPAKYKSTKPTAGFSYKPIDDVMVRASYSSGFVPPSYGQLLLNPTPSTNLTTVVDPRRGNTGRAVPTLSGGNPDLTPEDSKTWNVGVIIAPKSIALLRGLRLNLEYYSIEKRNNIGTIGGQTLVENEALFPDRVVRDPVPAGDPYGVGPITLLNLRSMNLFKAYNEGYDFSASYSRRTETLGGFEFSFNTSLPKRAKRKTVANQPYLDYVNFAGSGPLAFRYNTAFVWDYRGWSLGWNTRYYGKSRVSGPPINSSLLTIQASGSATNSQQSYHDLLLGYRFGPKTAHVKDPFNLLKGLELQLGILNVFNQEPPFDVAASSFWYSTWGNLRLREYRLSVKKSF